MPHKYALADLTSAEFAALPAPPVLLLPLGSQEDQGPHAPMGDFMLADILARRIAHAAHDAGTLTLTAPTLPFGAADHFGGKAGGLALSPAHFRGVLHDLLTDMLRHHPRQIVILNGHGGNTPIIHEVTLAIRRTTGIVIPCLYLWKIARQLMERRLGPDGAGRYGHGAEPLASLTLALRPDQARPEYLARPDTPASLLDLPVSGFGTVRFQNIDIDAPVEFPELAPNSTTADATAASAELGASLAQELVTLAAAFICHIDRP